MHDGVSYSSTMQPVSKIVITQPLGNQAILDTRESCMSGPNGCKGYLRPLVVG
jgi:hypothetical protein